MLGLDPGRRRIGVAISDPHGSIATPHSVIDRRSEDAVKRIVEICDERDVDTIVVGLPVTLAGEEGSSAEMARAFGEEVHLAASRNLIYWDERFTSVQAEQALLEAGVRREKRRGIRDMIAASLILQGYLDASGVRES